MHNDHTDSIVRGRPRNRISTGDSSHWQPTIQMEFWRKIDEKSNDEVKHRIGIEEDVLIYAQTNYY